MQFIAECFCIYNDQNTSEAMAYDKSLGFRLNMMGLDVRLSGHYDVRLSPDETEELLVQVRQAAAEVLADGVPRDVVRPGIEFHLASWSDARMGGMARNTVPSALARAVVSDAGV
jgi:hypothetical protein